MKKLCLAVLLATTLFACEGEANLPGPDLVLNDLYQVWVHSHEENPSGSVQIYRPENSRQFPVSRFRDVFEFKDDGNCRYLFLSPNDAHFMKDGTFVYVPDTGDLTVNDDTGQAVYKFRLIQLEDEVMTLQLR